MIAELIEQLIAASGPAFEATRREREAIGAAEPVPEDVHALLVVLAIMMSAPRIESTIEGARSRLPSSFDLRRVERLRLYATAVWHAHVRYTPVSAEIAQAVFREAIPFHRSMMGWARRLAALGWIRADPLASIGHEGGPRRLAHELVALAEWLTEAWPQCETLGLLGFDLARSTALGVDMLVVMSDEPRAFDPRTQRDLAQAFELMARAYDECRRVVGWIRRHEGDLEDIAPALDALGQSPDDVPAALDARHPRVPARDCLPN